MIEFTNLTVNINGDEVIRDLSLTIFPGEVFGFIGPNGSGKTAIAKALTTLVPPSSGDITINGISILNEPDNISSIIGYLPGSFGVYQNMTSREYLDFFSGCYQIPKHDRASLIESLLELVDLSTQGDQQLDRLTSGMKQRLSFARALLNDPVVLILDNPFTNLDNDTREEFIQLIRELSLLDKTVIYTSNYLKDLSSICNRIGILIDGQLAAVGSPGDIARKVGLPKRIQLGNTEDQDTAMRILQADQYVTELVLATHPSPSIRFSFHGSMDELEHLLSSFTNEGITIQNFSEVDDELERLYSHFMRGHTS